MWVLAWLVDFKFNKVKLFFIILLFFIFILYSANSFKKNADHFSVLSGC